MIILLIAAFIFGFGVPAMAETYWVSPSGSATLCTQNDGTDDPGSYMTPAALASNACASAGDIVKWKAGTYTGAHTLLHTMVPAGISPSQRSEHVCENDRGCIIAWNTHFAEAYGLFNAWNVRNYVIGRRGNGFTVDCVNIGFGCAGIRLHASVNGTYSDILIEGNTVTNVRNNGISAYEDQPIKVFTRVTVRYNIVDPFDGLPTEGFSPHGIYWTGSDWLIENNHVGSHQCANCYGIHGWHIAENTIVRNNVVELRHASARAFLGGNNETGLPTNNKFYNNTARCMVGTTCNLAFHVHSSSDGTEIYNNTVYGFSTFVSFTTGNVNSKFKNNVCTGGSCTTTLNGVTVDCGGTCTTTNPTVTAASHFVDAANGNFTLISGSSLINAGLDVGLPFNGAAPDRGAHESIPAPTVSITTNVASLTFPMNTNTPIVIPSATGATVACTPNPDACPGSPTVTTAQRRSGTDTIVDLTISGITSNACTTGQTWTVSYNASTGGWTGSSDIGGLGTNNQKAFSFTDLATTNLCTGSGPPTPPGAPIIEMLLNEGTGTTADNTGSLGASGDGTLQNGAAWGTGISGSALAITANTTQQLAIPYGNAVNVGTQDLTIGVWVFIDAGQTASTHYVIGPDHGTNQRYHLCARNGNWRMSIASTPCSSTTDSNLSVTEGWQHVCWTNTASTNTVQLYRNGVAGTGGATVTFSDFSLASNLTLGRVASLNSTGGRYDNPSIYTSLENCNDLFLAAQPPTGGTTGTFGQAAVQAQAVYLSEAGGTPINYGTLNSSKNIVAFGGVAWVFQIHCENVADCEPTAFRLTYRKDGSGSWIQVPDSATSDGISMWGPDSSAFLNSGATTARLTGTCAVTNGTTQLTASQVPNVDLPQDGCVMLRYIVQFWDVAGSYFEFRVERENGNAFTGTVVPARVDVINSQMLN